MTLKTIGLTPAIFVEEPLVYGNAQGSDFYRPDSEITIPKTALGTNPTFKVNLGSSTAVSTPTKFITNYNEISKYLEEPTTSGSGSSTTKVFKIKNTLDKDLTIRLKNNTKSANLTLTTENINVINVDKLYVEERLFLKSTKCQVNFDFDCKFKGFVVTGLSSFDPKKFDFTALETTGTATAFNIKEGLYTTLNFKDSNINDYLKVKPSNKGFTSFMDCINLITADLSDVLYNGISPAYLFWGCSKLVSVVLGSGSIEKSDSFTSMFKDCISLKTITGLELLDTSESESFASMFENCKVIETLKGIFSLWNWQKIKNASSMFSNCLKLSKLDDGNLEVFEAPLLETSFMMFSFCQSMSFETSNLFMGSEFRAPSLKDIRYMFQSAFDSKIQTIFSLQGFDFPNIEDASYCFYNLNATSPFRAFRLYSPKLKTLKGFFQKTKSRSIFIDFSNNQYLPELEDMSFFLSESNMSGSLSFSLNVPKLKTLEQSFNNYLGSSIIFSGWNTPSLENMNRTFYNCKNLTNLNLSGWDFSKRTNVDACYYGCDKLPENQKV